MKKPQIQKRLLPLIDIVFLLLAFFIVLPHGIKSNDILEIESLKYKNKDIARELEYYRWQYGPIKTAKSKDYRARIIKLSRQNLFLEGEAVPKVQWETRIKQAIENQAINFVIISGDAMDPEISIENVRHIESILANLRVTYIITSETVK